MTGDTLGDRIKRYEAVTSPLLTIRCPVVIRVDGKAFRTWTRGLRRPFDEMLIAAMIDAADRTREEMQGFKLAYIQSDEATFVLTDTDTLQAQPWFGYELNKMVSITASTFTAWFNRSLIARHQPSPAVFDARAFSVPADDVPNAVLWRQRDGSRNSLQMLARAHFTHRQLHGKNANDMHEMLHSVGVNWADCAPVIKNGTFITRHGEKIHDELGYDGIRVLIEDKAE